jgi:peptidoglycan-associated lipoprotein
VPGPAGPGSTGPGTSAPPIPSSPGGPAGSPPGTPPAAVASSDDILHKILGKQYDDFETKDAARAELDKLSPETRGKILASLGTVPDMPDVGASQADFKTGIDKMIGSLFGAGDPLTGDDRTHFHDALTALGKATDPSEVPDAKLGDISAINQAAKKLEGAGTTPGPKPGTAPTPGSGGDGKHGPEDAIASTDQTGFDANREGKKYHPENGQDQTLANNAGLKEVHFAFDKSDLTEEAKKTLKANAEIVKKMLKDHPGQVAWVIGHCDPRGSDDYNDALGQRRADAIRDFYIKECGIDPNSVAAVTDGKRVLESQTDYAIDRSATTYVGGKPSEVAPSPGPSHEAPAPGQTPAQTPAAAGGQPAAAPPGAAPPVAAGGNYFSLWPIALVGGAGIWFAGHSFFFRDKEGHFTAVPPERMAEMQRQGINCDPRTGAITGPGVHPFNATVPPGSFTGDPRVGGNQFPRSWGQNGTPGAPGDPPGTPRAIGANGSPQTPNGNGMASPWGQHSLTPEQQQAAATARGFGQLPPEMQRAIAGDQSAIQHLSPQQREQFNNIMRTGAKAGLATTTTPGGTTPGAGPGQNGQHTTAPGTPPSSTSPRGTPPVQQPSRVVGHPGGHMGGMGGGGHH